MSTVEQQVMPTHYDMDVKALSSLLSGSKDFGPVKITYDLDIQELQLTAKIAISGQTVATMVLNPEHPTATVEKSVGPIKTDATLTVDFSKKEITYDIEVESYGFKLYDHDGTLFSW